MNAGCYGGETWRYVARVEVLDARRPLRRAHARRLRDRLPQRCAAPTARAPDGDLHRGVVPLPAGRRGARARAHHGAARAAHRDAAAVAAERRQRVPQPAGRPRGAADRGVRAQGPRDRRRARVGEARELHRQSGGRRARGGHRGADRARARRRCATQTGIELEPEVRIVGEARRTVTHDRASSARSPC